jgi:hypothetical protein
MYNGLQRVVAQSDFSLFLSQQLALFCKDVVDTDEVFARVSSGMLAALLVPYAGGFEVRRSSSNWIR